MLLHNNISSFKLYNMRKVDVVNIIADKTGIPKVDVLVTLETFFQEVKSQISSGENIYVRGFGSFITKRRAAKIGRNIKKILQFIFLHIISLHLNHQKNL